MIENLIVMSLNWFPRRSESIARDDYAAAHDRSQQQELGKRVPLGLNPLADDGDAHASHAPSEDDIRRDVLKEHQLPAQTRNPTCLDREAVKAHVLSTYTATAPIHSFIVLDEDRISDQERAKMRAERLGGASGSSGSEINQSHLIGLIEAMDADLKSQWRAGEKVKSLRISIQASKLLSNTKVPQCYPSVFVLVATVMDTFGDFVAERLQQTAAGKSTVVASLLKRGQDASVDLIPAEAIEMCYNWFLKISSIRELLPRICSELSLLKCNRFLAKKARVQNAEVVVRLARQIRGVADPLVACHLRWYLFMRAAEVLQSRQQRQQSQPPQGNSKEKDDTSEWAAILEDTCMDNFLTLDQLRSHYFEKLWQESKYVSRSQYLHLLCPALQWQLDTMVRYGRKDRRASLLRRACEGVMRLIPLNASLLLTVMRSFPPEEWIAYGLHVLLDYVDTADVSVTTTTRLQLLEAFALIVAEHDKDTFPLSRAKRTALLNELWGRVETQYDEARHKLAVNPESFCRGNFNDAVYSPHTDFLHACSALLQFCCVHLGVKQVNVLLAVVQQTAERESSDSAAQMHQAIFRLLSSLICRTSDIRSLLLSDHFLALLRFVDPKARHALSRTLLTLMPKQEAFAEVTLELAKTLAETYEVLELTREEQAACTQTMVTAFRNVASADLERQMEFLCEARHALPNLDDVKVALIHIALNTVYTLVTTSAKRRNAAKAYFAFCHVTIPAISDVFDRSKLAVHAGAVAFQYAFVAQGEALLRLAMDFMKEMVPRSTALDGTVKGHCPDIAACMLQLIGVGAVAPSHGKYGHNYVLLAVLQWSESFDWDSSSTAHAEICCAILRCLSKSLAGGRLSYAFTRCGTEHYAKDPDYIASAQELCTMAAQSCVSSIHEGSARDTTAAGFSALLLFETCITFGDVADGDAVAMRDFAAEAWDLANKCHTGTDVLYTRRLAGVNRFAMCHLDPDSFAKATSVGIAKAERRQLDKQLNAADDAAADA